MNIDELEKLARAAVDGINWLEADELEDGTTIIDYDAEFIAAANPAAILELISINRELVAALDLAEAGLKWYYDEYMGNEARPSCDSTKGVVKFLSGSPESESNQPEEPVKIRSILANTGHEEADFLIDHIISADPVLLDTAHIVSFIRRLILEEIKGPDGHNTWKDAAVAERMKNLKSITRANGESNE